MNRDCAIEICSDPSERLLEEPNLLGKMMTGDETWVFQYDPGT
jgi:hypothetical protein